MWVHTVMNLEIPEDVRRAEVNRVGQLDAGWVLGTEEADVDG